MYREQLPPGPWVPWLDCLWVRRSDALHGEVATVLPDGCIDVMAVDGALVVAGPDTRPQPAERPAGGLIVGMRFRPGAAAGVLGLDASDLVDQRVDLGALWGREATELAERVGEAATVPATIEVLLSAMAPRADGTGRPDPAIQALVRALPAGDRSVAGLAAAVGLGERQLRRRSRAALGYGPKTLHRILRFQRFLTLAEQSGPGRLAMLAVEAGYADQAHLTRECQRLAGCPPAELVAPRAA